MVAGITDLVDDGNLHIASESFQQVNILVGERATMVCIDDLQCSDHLPDCVYDGHAEHLLCAEASLLVH